VSTPDDSIAETLLADIPEHLGDDASPAGPAAAPSRPPRNIARMMHKISVTLTLEVGCARVSLQEVTALQNNSVIELDTLAGEPLTIKINGTPIGKAEVVVVGDNYGLKILELSEVDLGSVA
jgi:flagellar motor switch protein FliN